MKRYLVSGGVARFGMGDVVRMSKAQYLPRSHNVELMDCNDDLYLCRAKTVIEFKVGEEIAIADMPKNLTDVLVPLDKPSSAADAAALAKNEEREAAAKKAAAKDKPKGKSKR